MKKTHLRPLLAGEHAFSLPLRRNRPPTSRPSLPARRRLSGIATRHACFASGGRPAISTASSSSSSSSSSGVVVLLEDDGALVEYEPSFMSAERSGRLMKMLMPDTKEMEDEVEWERDSLKPYSLHAREAALKRSAERRGVATSSSSSSSSSSSTSSSSSSSTSPLVTRRRVCAFGDHGVRYSYTNITREGRGWPPFLEEVRRLVEGRAEQRFNFVFCNFYADEHDYIGWHQDKEEAIVKGSTIAAVSLGATRRFCLRHDKTKHITQVMLENGSLLLMKGSTQERYRHSLPRMTTPCGPRISLTFRLLHEAPPSS